jgi:hypothetical protein
MSKRGSLLDDADFGGIGAKGSGGGGGGMDTPTKIKLGIVAVCFIGAGLGLAWYLGVFSGSPPTAQFTPEEQAQIEEEFQQQEAERERLMQLPGYTKGDA